RANGGERLIGICAQNLMVAARSNVAHSETYVAGQALLDFKMIIEYGRGIWVCLDSQAATARSGARQRCDSGHNLQGEGHRPQRSIRVHSRGNLRSSRNGRDIDAAPTHVVQQIVSHAESGPNARLAFPKRVPSNRRAGPKEPRGAVFCKQRIANPRLGEQDPVWSLSEAGPQFI